MTRQEQAKQAAIRRNETRRGAAVLYEVFFMKQLQDARTKRAGHTQPPDCCAACIRPKQGG